jgi:hypothetical protein
MAADSGVLLGIILVRSSFAIRYFPPSAVESYAQILEIAKEMFNK